MSILTDEAQGPERAPIPMVLAAGGGAHASGAAIAAHLHQPERARPRECIDVHTFAVLIGVGATTVNAYLAQESIADRHAARPVRQLSI